MEFIGHYKTPKKCIHITSLILLHCKFYLPLSSKSVKNIRNVLDLMVANIRLLAPLTRRQ